VALRFSNVMEPHDYAGYEAFRRCARERSWNAWGYIDARDGAQAVRKALELQATGYDVVIVANADTVMCRPSAELLAEVFPDVPLRRPVEGRETLLSIDKARRVLGYEPSTPGRTSSADRSSRQSCGTGGTLALPPHREQPCRGSSTTTAARPSAASPSRTSSG
jgi:nucleoside-diphosphate-sugar epimerase